MGAFPADGADGLLAAFPDQRVRRAFSSVCVTAAGQKTPTVPAAGMPARVQERLAAAGGAAKGQGAGREKRALRARLLQPAGRAPSSAC